MHKQDNASAEENGVKEIRPTELIYEIYPSSFNDSNGDGCGDLKGITEKLDYIASLNVRGIWIAPFYKCADGPEGDGGYAVDDYRAVDPKYGTLDDFKELVREAHKRDLRVYPDWVLPHTSDKHEWFEKSCNREEPYTDFYVWHDGVEINGHRHPPNNWLSVFGGGAWEWHDGRQQYYFHHFLKSQPALNLNNGKVQDAVMQEMAFWLDDDIGVDGFRFDSVPYANYDPSFANNEWIDGKWPRKNGVELWDDQRFTASHCQDQTIDFVARIRAFLDSFPGDKRGLGEVLCGREGGHKAEEIAVTYLDREKGLHTCYTAAHMGLSYDDYGWMKALIKGLIEQFPDGGNCFSLSNHDSPRMFSKVTEGMKDVHKKLVIRQLFNLVASLPGSLCMFQGEELALPQAEIGDHADIPWGRVRDPVTVTKGPEYCRDGVRTPMPWHSGQKNAGFSDANPEDIYLPIPQSHFQRAVNRQEHRPDSMLNFTRRLFAFRQSQPALMRGEGRFVDNTPWPVIAFVREAEDQTMLCVFNLSDQIVLFNPADHLDQDTLDRLSVASNEPPIKLSPYGTEFVGARSARTFSTHLKMG